MGMCRTTRNGRDCVESLAVIHGDNCILRYHPHWIRAWYIESHESVGQQISAAKPPTPKFRDFLLEKWFVLERLLRFTLETSIYFATSEEIVIYM